MKPSRTMYATLLAAATGAIFSGYAGYALARDYGPFARSLNQVDAIWLDSNSCTNGLSDELEGRGYVLTNSRRSADAILDVNFQPRRTEFGVSARYSATLRGEDGRVLFSTAGHESSITLTELCADISDDIADRMEKGMG